MSDLVLLLTLRVVYGVSGCQYRPLTPLTHGNAEKVHGSSILFSPVLLCLFTLCSRRGCRRRGLSSLPAAERFINCANADEDDGAPALPAGLAYADRAVFVKWAARMQY